MAVDSKAGKASTKMAFFSQLGLLMWKNLKLRQRNPLTTLFQMALPTFFIALLVVIRLLTKVADIESCKGNCTYTSFAVNHDLFELSAACFQSSAFAVFVTSRDGSNMSAFAAALNASDPFNGPESFGPQIDTTTFATEKDLLLAIDRTPTTLQGCKAAVVFNTYRDDLYDFDIRMDSTPLGYSNNQGDKWRTDRAFPFFQTVSPRDDWDYTYNGSGYLEPGYVPTGYLSLQAGVARALATVRGDAQLVQSLDNLQLQRMPYPEYTDDPFIQALKFGLPLLLMLSFLFTVLTIVRSVVYEKEKRLKESMKMMGLKNYVHWAAWFLQFFIMLEVSVVVISILFFAGDLVQHSDVSVIFVFLTLYAIATITFCFFISALFSRASTAAAASGIIWFLSYIPYSFIAPNYESYTLESKQGACFLSTTAMSLGAYVISAQEANGAGVTWTNLNESIGVDDPFNMGIVIGMLVLDILLYSTLTWYIEAVRPGEFGIPRPFYFPFTATYWCGQQKSKEELIPLLETPNLGDTFEAEPHGLEVGVSLEGLRKVFKKKVAVAGSTVKFFDGQVTALLGHNGAGKSTTMNMLTGLYPPTSGSAVVGGYEISEDISGVQKILGICPQHDVLWDALTVEEHLIFFCKLKGVPSRDIAGHVTDMLQSLELENKRVARSKTLSGGMKRKLSCGVALIGGSKVVILDEPTSGMDPSARRATWDLINKYKDGRTIILSTHFMDEADLLGDRIAIMSEGKLMCCGSSIFLKSKYGVGYHATIVKKADCKVEDVINLIHRHVPKAEVTGNVGAELTVLLPKNAVSSFPALFTEVDGLQEKLGIDSYGVSVTTMEEVFLKVGERATEEGDDTVDIQKRIESSVNGKGYGSARDNSAHYGDDDDDEVVAAYRNVLLSNQQSGKLITGLSLKLQQFRAMFIKRFLHSSRDKWAVITQLLLPFVFVCLALSIAKGAPKPADSPLRALYDMTDNYGSNVIVLGGDADFTASFKAIAAEFGPDQTVEEVAGQTTVSRHLLDRAAGGSRILSNFNRKYAVALEQQGAQQFVGLYNGQPFHSQGEVLTLLHSTLFNLAFPGTRVRMTNNPLPRNQEERAAAQSDSAGLAFTIGFFVLFGTAFLASSFLLFLVNEKNSKAKHLQFVSGVDIVSYWVASFAWDFLNFLVPTFLTILAFVAFDVEEYKGERLGYVLLLWLTYGFAIIPLMYLASFLFKVASTAFTRMTLFNIITGLAAMLTISIVIILKPKVGEKLKVAFLFLGNYCFGQGLSDIYTNYDTLKLCRQLVAQSVQAGQPITLDECCHLSTGDYTLTCQENYLSWFTPGIGSYVVGMLCQGVFFFLLVLAVEARLLTWAIALVRGRRRVASAYDIAAANGEPLPEDVDVAAERARIHRRLGTRGADEERDDVVVVKDLTKRFTTGPLSAVGIGKRLVAVDHLCFGIPRGECFGLLGINGAGKTTTFRMLTGDETMTEGSATMDGYDIRTNMADVRQRLGYCPQFDALINLMTGREVLLMYARLRGVPSANVDRVVSDLITALMLEKHADKHCGTYSGGNKRKLSTAIALVGDPPIVFLDEPTTGMDPGARRFLWNALIQAMAGGRSIVLTSHSMEECEALCTRLAIMVNGQFKCIGSPQHLKSRFGHGLSVTVKLADPATNGPFKTFMAEAFPQSYIKEEHQLQIHFVVEGRSSWSEVFQALEDAKIKFGLEDYAVQQTTLEQVFVDFARDQHHDSRQ